LVSGDSKSGRGVSVDRKPSSSSSSTTSTSSMMSEDFEDDVDRETKLKLANERALLAEGRKPSHGSLPKLCDGEKCSCKTHATRPVLRLCSLTDGVILAEYCSGSVAARRLNLNQSHVSTSARSGGTFFAGLFRFRFKDPSGELVLAGGPSDRNAANKGAGGNGNRKRSSSNSSIDSSVRNSSNSSKLSTSSTSMALPHKVPRSKWLTGGSGYGDGSLLIGAWAEMYEEWDPMILEIIADLLATSWSWSDAEWSQQMSASAEEAERKYDAEQGLAFPHGSTGAHRTDTAKSPTPP